MNGQTPDGSHTEPKSFEEIVGTAPVMIWMADANGHSVFNNTRLLEFTGLTREQALGDGWIASIHPDDRARIFAAREVLPDASEPIVFEFRVRRADGVYRWMLNSAVPRFDAEGQLIGFTGSYVDITERKLAEEELRRTNNLLRCLSDAQARLILDVEPSMLFDDLLRSLLDLTRSAYGFLGEVLYTSAGEPYLKTYAFTNIAWNSETLKLYERAVATGMEFHNLKTLFGAVMATGELVIANDPVNDPRSGGLPPGHPSLNAFLGLPLRRGGELVGVVGIANRPGGYDELLVEYLEPFLSTCGHLIEAYRSDRRRREAENALRKSEETTRALLDAIPDVIYRITRDGTFLACKASRSSDLPFPPEQMIGRTVRDVVPHLADDMMAAIDDAFETRKPRTYEYQLTVDGRVLEREARVAACSENEAVVIVRDMTEKKRAEEELQSARRFEAVGKLAGQIAHDFNNLLGPLVAFPQLIREGTPDDSPVRQLLDDMERAANQIVEINQELLTLGRRGHYPTEPLDLNDLIGATIRSSALPANIRVEPDFADDLSPVCGGSAQLTRVLSNLFSNAVEAMSDGGTLTVTTENLRIDRPLPAMTGRPSIRPGEYVRVQVRDTGPGIAPRVMDRVFEPFFTTKKSDRARGSGLGLSVVHTVIQDHKGYVDVQSTPGQGAVFSLYLPVHRAEMPDSVPTQRLECGHGERVLVVDDDPVQRRVACRALERLGYLITTATSGEEAVAFLSRTPQDLVLLDMVMDGIDGAETMRRIRTVCPELPVLLLSGFAANDRVEDALRRGAAQFLSKPVRLPALATAIRAALKHPTQATV